MAGPFIERDDDEDDEQAPRRLRERQRAWDASSDARALWPAVEPHELQHAADAIGRATAALLAGQPATLGRADGADARAIGIAALVTGVGPWLGHAVEQRRLDASAPLARLLARHLSHGQRRIETIRGAVVPLLGEMVSAGATPAVMKGFHTAHAFFPHPATRPIADADIIVAPRHIPLAERCLAAAGYEGTPRTAGPYKRTFTPAGADGRIWSFDYWHARNPWAVDLHDGPNVSLLMETAGRLDEAELFDQPWTALGVPLRVARPEVMIALHAVHGAAELYSSRLLRLVELVLIARHGEAHGGLDWRRVEDVLAPARALRFTYPLLSLAERLAPGTVDARVLARARQGCTARAHRVVAALTPTAPLLPDRVSVAERLMWTTGGGTLRRLLLMILPLRGAPWRTVVRVYHGRLRRLFAGRVRWTNAGSGPPPP